MAGKYIDGSLKKNNRIEAIISKKKLKLTLGFRTYCHSMTRCSSELQNSKMIVYFAL